jgi:hypothetical protein
VPRSRSASPTYRCPCTALQAGPLASGPPPPPLGGSVTLTRTGTLGRDGYDPGYWAATEQTKSFEEVGGRAALWWPQSACLITRLPQPRSAHPHPSPHQPTPLDPRRQEWEASRARQDARIDRIERGVASLADMARGMGEEVEKQAPVLDDVDRQLGAVTGRLKSNNQRLTGLVTALRGRRSACLDIFLVLVILAIVVYIVSVLQKRQ